LARRHSPLSQSGDAHLRRYGPLSRRHGALSRCEGSLSQGLGALAPLMRGTSRGVAWFSPPASAMSERSHTTATRKFSDATLLDGVSRHVAIATPPPHARRDFRVCGSRHLYRPSRCVSVFFP
jgi:hypothetical protein